MGGALSAPARVRAASCVVCALEYSSAVVRPRRQAAQPLGGAQVARLQRCGQQAGQPGRGEVEAASCCDKRPRPLGQMRTLQPPGAAMHTHTSAFRRCQRH